MYSWRYTIRPNAVLILVLAIVYAQKTMKRGQLDNKNIINRQITVHQSRDQTLLVTDLSQLTDGWMRWMNEGAGNVTLPIMKRRLGPQHVVPAPLSVFIALLAAHVCTTNLVLRADKWQSARAKGCFANCNCHVFTRRRDAGAGVSVKRDSNYGMPMLWMKFRSVLRRNFDFLHVHVRVCVYVTI